MVSTEPVLAPCALPTSGVTRTVVPMRDLGKMPV
jgi:hypothetical protein